MKTLIIGITAGLLSAGILSAGTEAVQTVVENESAFTDTLQAIVNFLPFPWNVVGGAVIAAGTAIFAWRRTKKGQQVKTDI